MSKSESNPFWQPRIIGMLMIASGAFTGPATYQVLLKFMRHDAVPLGIAWMITGITWFVLDIVARSRAKVPEEESWLFSYEVGGCIRPWPVWMGGIVAIVMGILFAANVI